MWLDVGIKRKIRLEGAEEGKIEIPNFNNTKKTKKIEIPEIYCYQLQNVIAEIESSSFYNKKNIYIERFLGVDQELCDYNNGHIISNLKNFYFIRKNKKVEILNCRVLFLGGNGSFNYFHWIIEILPKLIFFNQLNSIDLILVHENVVKIKSYADSFKLFLNYFNINIPVKYVGKNTALRCQELYYMSSFNHVVFNVKGEYDVNYIRLSDSKTKLISNVFFKNYIEVGFDNEDKFPKKFFIKRGNGISSYNRRNYNEEEVSKILINLDIKSIFIEDYSFSEQMKLFSNAELIVAPSGAFLTNIIFCKKNTKVVSWLPEKFKNFSAYSTLSSIFEVQMHFVTSESKSEKDALHGEYYLNKELLVNKILEISEV
ncbi:glycosyltransferase family 61 protein [Acinetobacter sp. C_4_1]|uniref:glycosyltransferase family 61 protein n=1 Tax=unclassified Acinetobacter TaxID=196816 RepID=UPI0021B7E2DD|nr:MULTISPECIES: glycosyltransferase family 61 protein [unclassified Acinetobacter]MCT8089474.1 glycosyltransferase family 61 protein [Acinetobacter sp. F_3_1]MCT8098158.1 glycosyltransferase family 61 protein [Acinetobacter sp. C_3_1]MCT8101074.1 glycosyltransferase family 61 protein [Acinetobacter sp. C_4_1]MCT8134825.1 glycosyltransferase family 61 protein [Acinetobacter sp. T_3_1]